MLPPPRYSPSNKCPIHGHTLPTHHTQSNGLCPSPAPALAAPGPAPALQPAAPAAAPPPPDVLPLPQPAGTPAGPPGPPGPQQPAAASPKQRGTRQGGSSSEGAGAAATASEGAGAVATANAGGEGSKKLSVQIAELQPIHGHRRRRSSVFAQHESFPPALQSTHPPTQSIQDCPVSKHWTQPKHLRVQLPSLRCRLGFLCPPPQSLNLFQQPCSFPPGTLCCPGRPCCCRLRGRAPLLPGRHAGRRRLQPPCCLLPHRCQLSGVPPAKILSKLARLRRELGLLGLLHTLRARAQHMAMSAR